MAKCELCGKGRQFGIDQKHRRGVAGGQWKKKAPRTRKIFHPNLHTAWVKFDNGKIKMRLCTKCLRKLKKEQKLEAAKTEVIPEESLVAPK